MNEHDIAQTFDCSVRCACGRTFTGSSLDDARAEHDWHFGVMKAKAALQEALTYGA